MFTSLFFGLFEPKIPWSVFVCTIGIAFLASCLLGFKRTGTIRYKCILITWIIACLYLILYSTVLGREFRDNLSIRLIPFWSIRAIQSGLIEVLYEKIYNVLFFMPYGCLLGFRSFSNRVSGFRGFRLSILIGCATSICIELLQLITRTGTCETDDVICNTVGCAVGAIVVYGLRFMGV